MKKEEGFHIYHDFVIQAEIAEVFDAITKPNRLVHWWPQKCQGEATLGATYRFFFTEAYDWTGRVSHVSKPDSFHIRMTDADEDWNPTTFGFELKKQDDGVLVQFFHKNWPVVNHHYKRSSYCWAMLLNGLKNYVEKGIIIPFEQRE